MYITGVPSADLRAQDDSGPPSVESLEIRGR